MNQNVTILKSVTSTTLLKLTALMSELLIMLKNPQVYLVTLAKTYNYRYTPYVTQVTIHPIC